MGMGNGRFSPHIRYLPISNPLLPSSQPKQKRRFFMNFIRLLPVIVSVLLLAAHFLRDGYIAIVVALAGTLALLFVRRPWVSRIFQIGLILGGLEWLRTLLNFINQRQMLGQTWGRLALILGLVALFTIGSTLVFQITAIRQQYQLDSLAK
jgi:Ni,Fe-hydrogenase I cytochrome b subunit